MPDDGTGGMPTKLELMDEGELEQRIQLVSEAIRLVQGARDDPRRADALTRLNAQQVELNGELMRRMGLRGEKPPEVRVQLKTLDAQGERVPLAGGKA
jgi:hypothetical protein